MSLTRLQKPGIEEHMAWIHIVGQTTTEEFNVLARIARTGTVEDFEREARQWIKDCKPRFEVLKEMILKHLRGVDW